MNKGMTSVLSALTGAVVGVIGAGRKAAKELDRKSRMSEKHLALFLMMNQWVKVKQEGKSLSEYFEQEGFRNIAIYGMSYAGETLVNELKNTDIHVVYGIDKNADSIYSEVDVVNIEENLEEVDVVVVTAIASFDEIKQVLTDKTECPVISLEDILYDV